MELKNQTLAYEILDLIDKNGGIMPYIDVLNNFTETPPHVTDNTLYCMLEEGLIYGNLLANESPALTPKGQDEIDAYRVKLAKEAEERRKLEEQARKKAAEEKAEKRSDRRHQFFHDIIMLIIGSALTLIVERFPAILIFFASFFN